MAQSRVLVRADASATIGHGHVMRCLALASALQARGLEVHFLQRSQTGDARQAIAQAGFTCHALADGDDAQASSACLCHLGGVHLVVLDHYQLGAAWVQAVRPQTQRVMVIDDLADRALDGDLLLDQNWHDDPAERYRERWPAAAQTLFGPRFALLRPEFRATPKPARTGALRRIVVAFGGSDPHNATGACAEALHQALPEIELDLVVGAASPHGPALQARWAGVQRVSVAIGVSDVARRFAQADLFVGAGGSMTWERACLGLPGITLPIAPNQQALCARLAAVGEGIDLGLYEPAATGPLLLAVQALRDDPQRLAAMAGALFNRCDGQGAERVADAVMLLLERRLG